MINEKRPNFPVYSLLIKSDAGNGKTSLIEEISKIYDSQVNIFCVNNKDSKENNLDE